MVWQDAAIDGQGLGIAGLRLADAGSTTAGSPFRVNEGVAGDQENPAVAALPDGGAFCVWQGGVQGFQRILGRVLTADGAFATPDLAVSQGNGEHQIDPVLAVLADGSVVVAWSSYRQDGGYGYDVFARRFASQGEPLGNEVRVNATFGLGRRSAALAALPAGGFVVAWISERQTGVRNNVDSRGRPVANAGAPLFAVNVVARTFDATGEPIGPEREVSEPGAVAANPCLAALPDGRVLAAWTRRAPASDAAKFDVACRTIGALGDVETPERLVNASTYGDQYRPRLAISAHGVLAVWTSMGQDGSWEGVFGRWINEAGEPVGDDIRINSQTGGGQVLPAVATGPDSGLLVAWSSNLPRTGFELFAQRLAPLLLKVRAGAPGRLDLQWPTVAGGVYQVEMSRDGKTWVDVAAPRAATGSQAEFQAAASGQMVLYRVRRVR